MQLIFSCSCQTWFYYSGFLHWYRSTYFLQGVDNLGYFKVVPIRPPPRGFVKQIPTNTLFRKSYGIILKPILEKLLPAFLFTFPFSMPRRPSACGFPVGSTIIIFLSTLDYRGLCTHTGIIATFDSVSQSPSLACL